MVNDCAFVGETLVKYLPKDFRVYYLKRSRSFSDKTVGIAWRIFKSKGNLYHIHYLLQDCYLALKFGKHPLVGHAHGSDLRSSIKHRVFGRIVRYNLKNCDKILVSTPDILSIAKEFRSDVEYLPNPVDSGIFYPKPLVTEKPEKKRVLIASDSNWNVKGTDMTIRALSKIKDDVEINIIKYGVDFERTLSLTRSLGMQLNVLPKVPHDEMNEYYWSADIVIDQFKMGSLGMVSLEAIACGRPVIVYVSSEYHEYKDFPLKDLNVEEEIADAILNADMELWQREYSYLEKNHKPEVVIERLLRIYRSAVQ